jgi:hypothetical protein
MIYVSHIVVQRMIMQKSKGGFCLFGILLLMSSCGKEVVLEKTIVLNHYASGSAIVYIDGKLYLQGDNMGYLLVMDTNFNAIDSIPIIDSSPGPIPKETKPDLEAASVLRDSTNTLLLISSGSLDPYRNHAWLVNTSTSKRTMYDLAPFYSRLKTQGFKDLNIEGSATMKDGIVLSARGSKSDPVNHLVFTSNGFWNEPGTAPIIIQKVGVGKDTGTFSGVSGMEYSIASDCLILTVSTENTTNSYDDGTIGKSYLWVVDNLSKKKTANAIVPDRVIDLELADSRFRGQKIEAACILSETATEMKMALAADNDDGKTALFMITLQK